VAVDSSSNRPIFFADVVATIEFLTQTARKIRLSGTVPERSTGAAQNRKEAKVQTRQINAASVTVPTGGYSQALELQAHTRLLFISGQIPVALDGSVPEGFEAQCRLAWQNVEAQLKAAGMSLDNIVLHRTFLADRRYTMANGAVRKTVFGDRKPALTTIIVGIFDEAWLIEIEAIAAA
jgi:2-iminobutanoate/2-iminopropanoate deaminase